MTVRVDGPYGDSGERPAWLKHPVLVIFAGGIGVRSMPEPPSSGFTQFCLGLSNSSIQQYAPHVEASR